MAGPMEAGAAEVSRMLVAEAGATVAVDLRMPAIEVVSRTGEAVSELLSLK